MTKSAERKTRERKKRAVAGVQIGSASLILIFTVLCLVIFGTLSLSSAVSDSKLAIRGAETVEAYYKADGEAEEQLKQFNTCIIEAASSGDVGFQTALEAQLGELYESQEGTICFTVDINEDQFIDVILQVADWAEISADKRNFRVSSYLIKNKVDYEIDDNLNVFSGDF